jgi:DNA invertase Pin-like site-specific DNA recombinase
VVANRLLDIKKQLEAGRNIYDLPLRVCFYARVSTDKDEQLNSLDNQITYFEDFIKNKDNWEFAGGYIDEGLSGKSVEKRTNFLKMIKDARDGAFDLIITKEISRFSRNTLDSIKYTQELLAYGVGVLFQSDNINTLMPDSELRLTIMASIAQEEVRKLSERLRFGYKRSIEKGRVLGQNNMFGYHKEDGRLVIVEDEAAVIRKIFELYIQGQFGVRRIARELEMEGIVSPNTGRMFGADSIKYIIQNPKYKGFYCSGKTVSIDYRQNKRIRLDESEWNTFQDENIPAIVSEEIWDKANAIYRQRGEKSKKNEGAYLQRYPFSGKLVCGEHGTSYHRHIYKSKKRGEQEVWNCKMYRLKGKVDGCDSPTLYTTELQEILSEIYKTIYDGRDQVINGLMEIYSEAGNHNHDYDKEITAKEAEIEKTNKSKDQLLDLLMDGLIARQDFKRRNDLLSADVERIQSEIRSIENEIILQHRNKTDLINLKKVLEEEFEKHDDFNTELNKILLDKIIVHKIGNDKNHIRLEIRLNLGSSYLAEVNKNHIISLEQIGISQAQVSRLEKNALKNMRKYIS